MPNRSAQRRKERERVLQRRLWEFFGLAVLIHLAFVPALQWLLPDPEPLPEKKKHHTVALLPSSAVKSKAQKRRQPEPEAKKEEEKKEDKKEKEQLLKGQVVDLPPSPDNTPPEDSKYLSEHNTRTERETRSRHQQQDYKNAMNELTRTDVSKDKPKEAAENNKAIEIGPEKPSEDKKKSAAEAHALELPDLKQRDRLALKMDPNLGKFHNQESTEQMKGNSSRLKLSVGDEDQKPADGATAPNPSDDISQLMPSIGVLSRISGAPANDHLSDLEEGDGTFLNSRQFKYASFFNRMKRGVSQHWQPFAEYRRRDPSGNIYGFRPRVTVVSVTLDADGALQEISVTQSSGLDFLDQEAIAAFRRAQPFPNPPKGLMESGAVTFPFGFHIEFSRGGFGLPF